MQGGSLDVFAFETSQFLIRLELQKAVVTRRARNLW
jgi:hypothetical protein